MREHKYLLKVLGITGEDVAKRAGVTRQAVSCGSKRITRATRSLIQQARLDPEKLRVARATYSELHNFFLGDI